MLSAHSTLSTLFGWIFFRPKQSTEENQDKTETEQEACIFTDIRSIVLTFIYMIIQVLLDESKPQQIINHILRHCAHYIRALQIATPLPIQIGIVVLLGFIFLPQIGKLLYPIFKKLQAYARKYLPTYRTTTHASKVKTPTQNQQNATHDPNKKSALEKIITTEVEKYLNLVNQTANEKLPQPTSTGQHSEMAPFRVTEAVLRHIITSHLSNQLANDSNNPNEFNNILHWLNQQTQKNNSNQGASIVLPSKTRVEHHSFHPNNIITLKPAGPSSAHGPNSPLRRIDPLSPRAASPSRDFFSGNDNVEITATIISSC